MLLLLPGRAFRGEQHHGGDGEVLCEVRGGRRQGKDAGGGGEDAAGVFCYVGEVEEERVR